MSVNHKTHFLLTLFNIVFLLVNVLCLCFTVTNCLRECQTAGPDFKQVKF